MNSSPDRSTPSVFSFSFSIFLTGLVLFYALASSETGLAAATAAVLLLMTGARLWCSAGLRRLDVSLSCGRDRLFPEESFEICAEIENRKFLPVWLRFELPLPEALVHAAEPFLMGETGLLPFERVKGSWEFRTVRRGVFPLGPALIVSGDLLGLFAKEKTLAFHREILVFPRVGPIVNPDLPFREYFGLHPSKGLIEDPAWYAGTRDYTGLKPSKSIHWKASARLSSLQEKIFEPTSHRKIFFLFDGGGFLRTADRTGFETALEIIASLAAKASESGSSFGIASNCGIRNFSPLLPLGRGPEHLGKVLELLARTSFALGEDLLTLLERAGIAGAGFIVVSASPDETMKKYFRLPAARRNRIFFIFASEPQDFGSTSYPAVCFHDLFPDKREGS